VHPSTYISRGRRRDKDLEGIQREEKNHPPQETCALLGGEGKAKQLSFLPGGGERLEIAKSVIFYNCKKRERSRGKVRGARGGEKSSRLAHRVGGGRTARLSQKKGFDNLLR